MTQQVPHKMPLNLVLLDGAGALMLSLGTAEHFGDVDILSGLLDFPHRAYVLMAVGTLLMLPMLFFIINMLRSRAEGPVMK